MDIEVNECINIAEKRTNTLTAAYRLSRELFMNMPMDEIREYIIDEICDKICDKIKKEHYINIKERYDPITMESDFRGTLTIQL